MSLPKPTKVSSEGSVAVYGCMYNPGHECKLARSNIRLSQDGHTLLRVPLAFQKKCRKEILSHHEDIRSWFNPQPSVSDLERYVSTPDTHTTDTVADKDVIGLTMEGILIDNGRIYPKYEVIWKQKPGLVVSLEDDLVEITDFDIPGGDDNTTMVLKAPQNERYYEDEDEDEEDEDDTEEDEGEDEDEDNEDEADDEDDGMTDAIRKIQDSIDIAREELAKLARTRRK